MQQRKLDDLVRKYELLKTGNVTALPAAGGGGGSVPEEILATKIAEAVQIRDEELRAEHERTIDKMVKKMNKKMTEAQAREKALVDEKIALEEERNELSGHVDDLTKFNSQLALEVENIRSQLNAAKDDARMELQGKHNEVEHAKREAQRALMQLEEGRHAQESLQDLRQEFARIQEQLLRAESAVKEKAAHLEESRSMMKWSNEQLQAEKERTQQLEFQLKQGDMQYREMEESWRAKVMENANMLAAANNRRLEELAMVHQQALEEEQDNRRSCASSFARRRRTARSTRNATTRWCWRMKRCWRNSRTSR